MRLIRQLTNMSMRAFARVLGIKQSSLLALEHAAHHPAPSTITAYADFTSRSADLLLRLDEQDRAFALLFQSLPASTALASAASDEICEIEKMNGLSHPSRLDCTYERFLDFQNSEKNLEALRLHVACWWFALEYVLSHLDLVVMTPRERPINFRGFDHASAKAAAVIGEGHIRIQPPRGRADLLRLCFTEVKTTFGPGGELELSLRGLTQREYHYTI
jgi:transcriptional regulator with XRE-family HTH domain